jgi:prepilin-type N-terminal cleavage/methylation domain-containing protein
MLIPTCTFPAPRRARFARRGFTLIEASLATLVIGVAFVATLQLIASGTVTNVQATSLTTGMNLARGMNEYLLQQKFSDLKKFNGVSYKPAKDSRGADITEFGTWRQTIAVRTVNPSDLTKDAAGAPLAVQITVTVSHDEQKICDLSWYVFDATP